MGSVRPHPQLPIPNPTPDSTPVHPSRSRVTTTSGLLKPLPGAKLYFFSPSYCIPKIQETSMSHSDWKRLEMIAKILEAALTIDVFRESSALGN